jgi:hypothetical protein
MSRSGYSDDCDGWSLICWRGAVNSAIKGFRGQCFIQEAIKVLDEMPEKKLIAEDLVHEGSYCLLGAVGVARGLDVSALDPEDYDTVSKTFNIAPAMAREIVSVNDDDFSYREITPEERWHRVRNWLERQLEK